MLSLLALSGCSINTLAANALTGAGNADVFTGDGDPELVGDALPFAIKMYESLLAANPTHQGLLVTTGSLFVMYANAFVQTPAELLPRNRFAEQQAARSRAKKLYLRGMELLYRGLNDKYPGFRTAFQKKTLGSLLAKTKKADVPALYWAAAAGLAAYSLDNFDMALGLRVPEFLALIDRAYVLNPDFNSGALDEFYLLFYASVPESMGGDRAKAGLHYIRAVEKSRGLLAGPYVSYAQAITVPAQDYAAFRASLGRALAVDPEADPANRLVNVLAQRKAEFLLENAALFFIEVGGNDW
jgi:predicted anti-sigma-YlaC factor YlaD